MTVLEKKEIKIINGGTSTELEVNKMYFRAGKAGGCGK